MRMHRIGLGIVCLLSMLVSASLRLTAAGVAGHLLYVSVPGHFRNDDSSRPTIPVCGWTAEASLAGLKSRICAIAHSICSISPICRPRRSPRSPARSAGLGHLQPGRAHGLSLYGEVIDTKTRRIVTTLADEAGKPVQSEKMVEVDFEGGKPCAPEISSAWAAALTLVKAAGGAGVGCRRRRRSGSARRARGGAGLPRSADQPSVSTGCTSWICPTRATPPSASPRYQAKNPRNALTTAT